MLFRSSLSAVAGAKGEAGAEAGAGAETRAGAGDTHESMPGSESCET